VKVSDLVMLKPEEYPRHGREVGTILAFDIFVSSVGPESMAKILWNTGVAGWILSRRVAVINESR
jgi:hypothetical protein